MHIKYSSKLEARRALANNGKVFAGTVMIGVIPCRDQVPIEINLCCTWINWFFENFFQGVISEGVSDKENQSSISFNAPSPITPVTRNKLYPDLHNTLGGGNTINESSIYESPITSPGRYTGARPLQGRFNDTEVIKFLSQ